MDGRRVSPHDLKAGIPRYRGNKALKNNMAQKCRGEGCVRNQKNKTSHIVWFPRRLPEMRPRMLGEHRVDVPDM